MTVAHYEPPAAQQEEDPFGPYEYVEADDRCRGAEGHCMWDRCTQRQSVCRCLCPVCVGDDPHTWGYDGPY
ncbi:hypothetical protein ACFV3R_25500 [Streptomyces sp. NPDC059740]|uniref:hypothetical protein n=1 Tax=Streptomyces sp. NPDC059740 TaxID=3346926 RepID=UPI00364BAF43